MSLWCHPFDRNSNDVFIKSFRFLLTFIYTRWLFFSFRSKLKIYWKKWNATLKSFSPIQSYSTLFPWLLNNNLFKFIHLSIFLKGIQQCSGCGYVGLWWLWNRKHSFHRVGIFLSSWECINFNKYFTLI